MPAIIFIIGIVVSIWAGVHYEWFPKPVSLEDRRATEVEKMQQKMPTNCKFVDLGLYDGDKIRAVICTSQNTTNVNYSWRVGKSGRRNMLVTEIE